MKYLLLSFALFFSFQSEAQTTTQLSETIRQLDNSLIKKDTAALDSILHKNVMVVHSNGFAENKSSMKQNTISSFIKYHQITPLENEEFVKINDEAYMVYRKVEVAGIYDIYDFKVNLRLMEVWIREDRQWQLIGRQSLEIKSE